MIRTVSSAVLNAAARSARVRRLVERTAVARPVLDRFVAGTDVTDALRVARDLTADRLVSLDHLGEDTTDRADADRTVTAYRDVLRRVGDAGLADRVEVSVKLSALGQALPVDGAKVALDNAREVCAAAAAVGTTVTVDMEDHTTTDGTLAVVADLRADFPTTGAVLQAYLRRTEGDCADLAGPGSRVRLCKGAYAEPASVAFRRRADVDRAYVRCLKVLMAGAGYPMVASHDPRIVDIAKMLATRTGRGPDDYEFQLLYGVRPGEQRALAADGHRTRVYVPYGAESFPYFMRRLAERPANLAFGARALVTR